METTQAATEPLAIEAGPDSPSGRGGKREGAGRKPTREKHAAQIEQNEAKIAEKLDEYSDNLDKLACGLAPSFQETWVAAGTVTVKSVMFIPDIRTGLPTDQPYKDRNGRPIEVEQPVFPDLDPRSMVMIERKAFNRGPDAKANIYLRDSIVGKAATNSNDPPELDTDRAQKALDLLAAIALDPTVPTNVQDKLAEQVKELLAAMLGED